MKDTIYRQDAIATIGVMYERCDTYDITDYRDLVLEAVKVLPSADRPQGEWIYTNNPLRLDDEWACSRCGNISFVRTNFCDRCGCRMKGADDDI